MTEIQKELTTQEIVRPVTRYMSNREMNELYHSLRPYFAVYGKIWRMSIPRFTESIPTASVGFDRFGREVEFNINPKFWSGLTPTQKKFVIIHEVSHVLFLHGLRAKDLIKEKEENPNVFRLANIAMDLSVNQYITNQLKFSRLAVDPVSNKNPKGRYVWLNTVFTSEEIVRLQIKENDSFEYYYGKIRTVVDERKSKIGDISVEDILSSMGQTVDEHGEWDFLDSEAFSKKMQETLNPEDLKKLFESAGARQEMGGINPKNKIKEGNSNTTSNKGTGSGQNAGNNPGRNWMRMVMERQPPKRKWETVIKNWSDKNSEYLEKEQWKRRARQYENLPKDFFLPSVMESDQLKKGRIVVWFFQDTSGSCVDLAPRFLKAAKSLPEDRFDVRMHCFDTEVYPMKKGCDDLFGFGGTTFTCIENFIQQQIKETGCDYPKAVFIITDGMGDKVQPELSDRWFIFNSTSHNECFPETVKMFPLEQFE